MANIPNSTESALDLAVRDLIIAYAPTGVSIEQCKMALIRRWAKALGFKWAPSDEPLKAPPVYPIINDVVCYCGTKHHQAKCPCCGRAMGWEEAEVMTLAAKGVSDQMKLTIGGVEVPASWGRPMRYTGAETSRVSVSAPNKSNMPRAAFDDFDAPLRALNWHGGF